MLSAARDFDCVKMKSNEKLVTCLTARLWLFFDETWKILLILSRKNSSHGFD